MPSTSTGKSPGRPSIGPLVKLNLPEDFLQKAEAYAQVHGRKRADVLREWAMRGAEVEGSSGANAA